MTDGKNVQCGSCAHFGNDLPNEQLIQIRVSLDDSNEVVAGCDAPNNVSVHLRVSALGSCDAWTPVAA
ncbi:MAG: hypothetical protein P8J45_11375 [Phycisphaerales bacterium]|jgi:hypothetical protein|nr:hypothetical protein [Phycisphaerales bacterium]